MLEPDDGMSYWDRQVYQLGFLKQADDGAPAYNLTGLLYATEHKGKPFGLLSVPNALVRGIFDAMTELGIELPLSNGKLNAHVTVFRPEELAQIGGVQAIANDRGKPFRYTLGRLVSLVPEGWADVAKCWMMRVHSPELQALRRSYGLSSLPNNGKFDFHISCAVLKKGVLGRSETTKNTVAA